MKFDIKTIVSSPLFQKSANNFFGKESLEIVIRPACYFVRIKNEDNKLIKRIVVLPPHGFTGDETDLLNPHPETRNARVNILGKIDPAKKGFRPLFNEVQFSFAETRNVPTETTSLYVKFSNKHCKTLAKSWKNWFYVVKKNGWGHYHSLKNLTDEWVIVLSEKELVDQKPINLKSYLDKLSTSKAKELEQYLKKIEKNGDGIFRDKIFVENLLKFPSKILAPILIQMLNVQETGKHENCTFFALLLKIAKKHPSLVFKEVNQAIELKLAPYYYLSDLNKKLKKI